MLDRTYDEALRAAPPPRLVILGPATCRTCGAWVEWCGVEWLGLLSDEDHECKPYLAAQQAQRASTAAWQAPGAMGRKVAEWRELGRAHPDALRFTPEGTLDERRQPAYVQQAHPMASWEERTVMQWLGRLIGWALIVLSIGLAILVLDKVVNGA